MSSLGSVKSTLCSVQVLSILGCVNLAFALAFKFAFTFFPSKIYVFLAKLIFFVCWKPQSVRPVRTYFISVMKSLIMSELWLLIHVHISADPKSEYKEAHGTTLVMYSEIIFSVSGLNTLSVRVRVVSLSGLRPVRVTSLSGLCPCPGCVCPGCVLSRLRPVRVVSCPGYVPVWVVSVLVMSVWVVSCPGCSIIDCIEVRL